MRNIPHTYSEWAELLEEIESRTDDAAVLEAMMQGTIEWQSGVAECFMRRLLNVVNRRMNEASDRFGRDMNRIRNEERNVIQALLSLRREMRFLFQVVSIPAIPQREREQCQEIVLQQAEEMQRALEESAKRDRSGRMTSIVKNHKINVFETGEI